jgi:hypothetical protein
MAKSEKTLAADQVIGMTREAFSMALHGKWQQLKESVGDIATLCDHLIKLENREKRDERPSQ